MRQGMFLLAAVLLMKGPAAGRQPAAAGSAPGGGKDSLPGGKALASSIVLAFRSVWFSSAVQEVASGKDLRSKSEVGQRLASTPDGATLAAVSPAGWDAGRAVHSLLGHGDRERRGRVPGQEHSLSAMAFSPDGTHLAWAGPAG